MNMNIMKKKSNKKWIVVIIAILTAVVGIFIAVGAYLKKKAEVIGENLDYDSDFYEEEEDYYDSNDNVVEIDNGDMGVLEDNDIMPDGKGNDEIIAN